MEIKKKATTSIKKANGYRIANISVPSEETGSTTPVMMWTEDKGRNNFVSHKTLLSVPAWKRAAKGVGAGVLAYRNGVVSPSVRYKVMLSKDAEGKDIVIGMHVLPADPLDKCSFPETLKTSMISDEDAMFHFYPTSGEIDVVAFPADHRASTDAFVAKLEALEKIDESTVITAGNCEGYLSQIHGNTAIFRIVKKAK